MSNIGKIEADRQLLLNYHHQLGHVFFQQLKDMAKQGVIPKQLLSKNTTANVCCMCLSI
jgi:hypothetical protein